MPTTSGLVDAGLGDEGGEVVVGERRRDGLLDLAAGLLDRGGELLVHVLAEGVVGVDDRPVLAAVLDRGRTGALREHVRVVGPVERVLVAGLAGQGRGAGADVDEELLLRLCLGRDGQGGRGGRHVEDDVGLVAVVHLLRLGVGDVRLVLVVGLDDLDVLGDRLVAVLGLVVVDGHLDGDLAVGAGQVLVDAGLVVEQTEDDLVVADLARPPARTAAATGSEHEAAADGGGRHRDGLLAHVPSWGVMVLLVETRTTFRGTRGAPWCGTGRPRCRATRRPAPGRAGSGGRPRWRRTSRSARRAGPRLPGP